VLEAITVDSDPRVTKYLMKQWEALAVPVPLKILESPYREVARPIITYVKSIRRSSPRDLIAVYLPEYVVGRWWEQLLHNQTAQRLKSRLQYTPGVVVVSVPWQLASSEGTEDHLDDVMGGAYRGMLRHGADPATASPRPTAAQRRAHLPGYESTGEVPTDED
jgi:hypothetical protein